MRLLSLLFILLLYSSPICSQNTGEDQLSTWYQIAGSHKLNENVSLKSGIEWWYYEPNTNFNQLLLTLGINYAVQKQHIITLTYRHVTTDESFATTNYRNTQEHRLYEQYTFKHKLGRFRLSHRNRLEHRFFYDGKEKKDNHRYRYMLKGTLTLNNTFNIQCYEEIFLDFKKEFFGQNRLFAGLGINLSKHYSSRIGYMRNHFKTKTYNRLLVDLIIKTGF